MYNTRKNVLRQNCEKYDLRPGTAAVSKVCILATMVAVALVCCNFKNANSFYR